jgi:DNA-binding transcriptional regulator YiaG
MTTFASSLKKEIARVARKELKDELGALRKASASYRTEIAALKRQVRELQVAVRQTSRRADKALHTVAPDAPAESPKRGRRAVFSAERFKAQRERLGLTQKDMAAYLGTSTLSVWKWETGQVTPRARFLPAILGLRTTGKREVLQQLARGAGGATD